jgi:hypothetical protein
LYRLDEGGDALVDVKRDHVLLERGVFGFASADELGVESGS